MDWKSEKSGVSLQRTFFSQMSESSKFSLAGNIVSLIIQLLTSTQNFQSLLLL